MTKAMNRILPALLLLVPMLAAAQAEREPIDSIVALVEEDVILQSELDQAIEGIMRQVEGRGENLPPRNVLEQQVLERLIMQRLQVQRAEATGIRVSDADVDQALERVARQNNLTVARLRQLIEADGMAFEQFRREIRNDIMTSRLSQRVVNSMGEITETEIDILLSSERFGGREYLLSQIVITLPDSATPQQAQAAESRVQEVYRQIEDGMSFSAAAMSYSQGPDALEGGEVGWRSLSALPRSFAEAVDGLAPGDVSEPLRTPAGFVILKVQDVRERSKVMVPEYRARHLLISPSELVSEREARERIEQLRQRILDGESFEDLAREYSSDQSTANIGGLMDWFPAGAQGPQIRQAVESLEPGELSEPFRSPEGWHLVELLDERERDRTEDVMRAEARDMLMERKSQEELDQFLRELRNESFVEIRL